MTLEWLERKQIMVPKGKILINLVDVEEPTFLDHVYSGCTQRESKPNEIIFD